MVLWRSVLLAFRQIRRNALRAALTTLGVLIGVAAVIAMVALGRGATASVTGELSSLGQNLLFVAPGTPGGGGPGARSVAPLFTLQDVVAIENEIDDVAAAAPVTSTPILAVRGNQNVRTSLTGTTDGYLVARNLSVKDGRRFTLGEEKSGAAVALVGQTVADELFGGNALGNAMRIGNVAVKVVGMLEPKGQSTFGMDQDNVVIVPFQLMARRITGRTDVASIMVSAKEGAYSDEVKSSIQQLMNQRRHIVAGRDPDFFVQDMKEVAAMVGNITGVLTSLLAAIAAISLLVGGIGIMNIMLVAVTERTREVGLRLSIGARARDVLVQFLIEAVVLSTLGGVAGIGVGLVGSFAVSKGLGIPFVFDLEMLLLPFFFSVAIGAVFGFMPARRAARLNPIDALRHE